VSVHVVVCGICFIVDRFRSSLLRQPARPAASCRNDQGERRPAQRESLSPDLICDRAKGRERGFVLTIDGFALWRPGAGAIAALRHGGYQGWSSGRVDRKTMVRCRTRCAKLVVGEAAAILAVSTEQAHGQGLRPLKWASFGRRRLVSLAAGASQR
jgi:hypothetical protein